MDDETKFFPRKINVVVPLGESVVHFLVVGKDEAGALAKIAGVLAAHGLNLLNAGTYETTKKDEFLFNFFADFAKADVTLEAISTELKALSFVSLVSASRSEEAVYDKHMFPVVLFEGNRAVLLLAESVVSIERDLQRQIGKQGQQVLFEVGRSSSLIISAVHRNMLPDADRETLLATACDDMRARGWGLTAFQAPKDPGEKMRVTVREPIFAGIGEAKESWWLMGLASGFFEAIYGHRTVVVGRPSYDADKRVFSFELAEFSPDSRSNRDLV
jgi:predicted amino acid-binding ACT domain protein